MGEYKILTINPGSTSTKIAVFKNEYLLYEKTLRHSSEEIEKYNSSFINKLFQNKEADIVYKIKDKNIFFLIEHQSKIDYSMPFRLLEYEVAIIRSAIDKSKIKNKSYKIPLVMPIVLYTGKQKWNANKYLEKSQEKIQGLNIKIGNYSLVDINNYTEKELLEDNTFISKMMLIEKSKNTVKKTPNISYIKII